ncbi:OmpA family protein [Puniceibacterium sp. IMCC21224]|uniref:OmpA family protein n=1 Tax=Puniceibacterium sp. IMCC21224 TaxID=1618204 RepID=UPI00064DD94E|nr:OmpA family protein [Puniceibacterium sp. IMCC21224]KMK67117.1 outer membrane protein/peptidoglycan-associated (lipo)protein [Puniceibacterium sp. IMCC21224]
MSKIPSVTTLTRFCALSLACILWVASAETGRAQSPFEGGWSLQPTMSNLRFQSVKKQTVVESSSFASLQGSIDDQGTALVTVLLDSVDTNVDLRNVRMRFLFFETFKFPEARIVARIDPAQLADLPTRRRKTIPVSYVIDLHGVQKAYESEVIVTLLSDDMVSVASDAPISVAVSDFNLLEGLQKLQEAANVDIIPSATISFDWVFARDTTTATPAPSPVTPSSVALETQGNFDAEACKGRFEILSRTGNIYFTSGSARLQDESAPLLDSLADIVLRCPDMMIEVGGHTDSVGGEAQNQRLSQSRAASVTEYLLGKGLGKGTMVSKGYGELSPIASNDTSEGRLKNRRIEFKVLEN